MQRISPVVRAVAIILLLAQVAGLCGLECRNACAAKDFAVSASDYEWVGGALAPSGFDRERLVKVSEAPLFAVTRIFFLNHCDSFAVPIPRPSLLTLVDQAVLLLI
jgi:hypothetical protein